MELEAVTCCGAGDIHEAEPDYYLHLNARILAYAEATGCDTLMTVCNVCTLNLRQANYQLQSRRRAARAGQRRTSRRSACRAYQGTVDVLALPLARRRGRGLRAAQAGRAQGPEGPRRSRRSTAARSCARRSCSASRTPTGRESLERIIEACGGEAVDYPAKIKCCGFPIIQAREETALGELIQPIEQAKEAGADAMVTPCPLCHLSLDAWQSKLKKQTGKDFQMPILHLSQLIGVAAGLTDSELKFKRHVVSVEPVLEKLEHLGSGRPRREAVSQLMVWLVRRRWRAVGAALPRLRLVRGGLAAHASARVSALAGLPAELDGLRIAHLSDFHLGAALARARSRAERAVDWVRERRPDLVCVTGDLLSHPRGRAALRAAARPASDAATSCSATTTSPSRATRSRARPSSSTSGCGDAARRRRRSTVELRGRRVQLVGVDPRSYCAAGGRRALADPAADLRILLCHFPASCAGCPPAPSTSCSPGHLHAGQIVLPYPGGQSARAPARPR